MARIVVLGAGVCELATAMLLARDGHEVVVLERDREPPPEAVAEAWDVWSRRGVVQFRQPRFLQARVREVLDRELPDLRDALLAAGGVRVDPIDRMPASIADRSPRIGDERLVAVTARRPTLEQVFATAAEAERGVRARCGRRSGERPPSGRPAASRRCSGLGANQLGERLSGERVEPSSC
jgi:2-polyprenyl-6-methoxyphenol hydroxylase-like FAD-dependent oxidoreductase